MKHTEGNTEDLKIEDPKGVKVFCDAGMPNFNPIDYDKNKIEYQYEERITALYNPPPDATPPPPSTGKFLRCRLPLQRSRNVLLKYKKRRSPVGSIQGDQKIVEYRLIKNEGQDRDIVPIKSCCLCLTKL